MDVFASFVDYALSPENNERLPLSVAVGDPTGQIVNRDGERILLEKGDYLIAYQVSGLMREPGYMQVTPFYNSAAHLEEGIYFMTGTGGGSGAGAANFIARVPETTALSLTFNSSVRVTEVQMTMTILKLRSGL